MALNATETQAIIKEHQQSQKDTGSVEVQVALLTTNINKLTGHFKKFAKDLHSRRGLMTMINKRRNLLAYLKHSNRNRYADLIKKLNLRG